MSRNWTRRSVLLFAALGYAYLFLVAALLAGLAITLVLSRDGGALIWLPLGMLFLVATSLRPRFDVPPGFAIEHQDAPRLLTLIDEVRASLDAPAPHLVQITRDLNAFILDIPRYGIFGSRRTLSIGLPLLHVLPAAELRAVLAHEFAHFSRRHGRTRAWMARLQSAWHALAIQMNASRNPGGLLILPFFRWYAPRFGALVDAMSREHEFESDALANDVAGPGVLARALMRMDLAASHYTRRVLPGLRSGAAERAEPPADILQQIGVRLQSHLDDPRAQDWLRRALQERSVDSDSHPALVERLTAIGVAASPDQAAGLLGALQRGEQRPAIHVLLDPDELRFFAAGVAGVPDDGEQVTWRLLHNDAQIWRTSEARLRAGGAVDIEALRSAARWAAMCQTPDSAINVLQRLTERHPDDIELQYFLGMMLVENEPARAEHGAELLEAAMARDSLLAHDAARLLARHYSRANRPYDVRRCRNRRLALEKENLSSLQERLELTEKDTLRASELPPQVRESIAALVESHAEVHDAWLVEKQTRHMRGMRTVALALHIEVPWYRFSLGSAAGRVCQQIAAELVVPGQYHLLVAPVERRSRLWKRLDRIGGARVYRRTAPVDSTRLDAEWTKPPLWMRVPPTAAALGILALLFLGIVALGAAFDAPTKYSERIDELERALKSAPEDPRANLELTWALIELERYAEARPMAEKAARLNPEDPYAQNSFGYVLLRLDEVDHAAAQFERAIQLSPQHEYAHFNLARAHAARARWQDADTEYTLAVAISPDRAHVHYEHAWVLMELYRREDAERAIRTAIRLQPDVAEYAAALATIYKELGRVDDALGVYHEFVARHPEDYRMWAEIGILEHVKGRHAEAISAFDEALRINAGLFDEYELVRLMYQASRAGRQYAGEQ